MCRSSGTARDATRSRSCRIEGVDRAAFILAPRDDASSAKGPIAGCDDRVAVLPGPVVAIQDDPVTGVPRLVRPGRVGQESCVAARTSACVQNGEPRVTGGIEAPRGNPLKFACSGFLAIFPIDVEKLQHARRLTRSDRRMYAAQPVGQGIPYSRKSLGAEPCNCRKASVMSRRFKIGERLKSEFLVEPIRKYPANTRHGGKQSNGISFPAQPIQHRKSSVREQLANRASDGLAHMWHLLQTIEATIPKYLVQPHLHRTDARCRTQVRSDSIPVGALVLQQFGGLLKASRHILIDPVHRQSPLACISKPRSEAAADTLRPVSGQKFPHVGNSPQWLVTLNLVRPTHAM